MLYSRSSPCDQSRKGPALVTTTFMNCGWNFVMKSSRKRPLPWATVTSFGIIQLNFPLFLSFRKRLVSDHKGIVYMEVGDLR